MMFDRKECLGKNVKVKEVIALSQNESAGEDGIFVRLYKTEQMPSGTIPICLFNRERTIDATQPSDYFTLQQNPGANWWHSLLPQTLAARETCLKNQSREDAKELANWNVLPKNVICVQDPVSAGAHTGRYLVNFHNGRYFLRGLRLNKNHVDIYLDILQYIRSIAANTNDISLFPSTPPEITAIKKFSNADNLSFANCGKKKLGSRQKRDGQVAQFVYSGFQAREDAHPWHALVRNNALGLLCGGTLISKQTVLTVAHCIFKMNPRDFDVTIGKYDTYSSSDAKIQTLKPSRLVTHPNYVGGQFNFDVGLIVFETGFEITEHVRPICLWNEGSNLERVANKSAVLVGFGLAENFSVPTTLQEAQLAIRSNRECYLSDRPFFGKQLKPGDNFCAGHTKGASACVGDSGGSLSIGGKNGRWFVRGVVSAGKAKVISRGGKKETVCNPDGFSLFTDVAFYLDWIVENSPDTFFQI
ncbi:Hypothetical predicted protein [Cloeon dipterum]|nr:Hypothetical predicted protein [Cloeon dipterum]